MKRQTLYQTAERYQYTSRGEHIRLAEEQKELTQVLQSTVLEIKKLKIDNTSETVFCDISTENRPFSYSGSAA